MTPQFRVMVLGGYGVFGARVCRLLASDSDIAVIIAGRNAAPAEKLRQDILAKFPRADISIAIFDYRAALRDALGAQRVNLVVHCSGPFQGQDYGVARACIEAGAHYTDLADGRDYVEGFGALNGQAKKAGVSALSGASTTPALSACIADELAKSFESVDAIHIGVLPGNRAPRGLAVIEAILSYTGKPMPRWRNGVMTKTYGWQDLKRETLSVGGAAPIGGRWISACDAPDVTLFVERYPGVQTVTFHAGLELSILHLGLWALSWAVRIGAVSNLAPAAGLFKNAANLFYRFGADRGGMFVEMKGRGTSGAARTMRWSLIAEGGDGPWIPVLAAVILARKLARDEIAHRGAGPAVGIIALDEFNDLFSRFAIKTAITRHDDRNAHAE